TSPTSAACRTSSSWLQPAKEQSCDWRGRRRACNNTRPLVARPDRTRAITMRRSALRDRRGEGVGVEMPTEGKPLEIGKGRIIRQGSKIAILSLGTRLAESLKAAEELASFGLSTTVADARFAKPIDSDLLLRLANEHEVLITIEEGAIGGFAAQVYQTLSEHGALD